MSRLDEINRHILDTNGQGGDNIRSRGGQGTRAFYPAVVVSVEDPLEQNRITARIVNLDQNGNVFGGRDKDVLDGDLVLDIPMMPMHVFVRPLPGEMVLLLLEDPSDNSAPRYWIGPIINSELKLNMQLYKEAVKIYDHTPFNLNPTTKNNPNTVNLFPEQSDIALQGRNDADLMLKQREVYLVAGKFNYGTFNANTASPSYLRLKQINPASGATGTIYSQAEIQSTVVNLYSPIGDYRSKEISQFEKSDKLAQLGNLANTLHPSVKGDELVKLLNLIIQFLLLHIHTPQNPAVITALSKSLSEYTVNGKLQDLLSTFIRIN